MTLKTLFEDVLALGFEEYGEMSDAFIFAARRANRTIALECGFSVRAILNVVKTDTGCTVELIKGQGDSSAVYKESIPMGIAETEVRLPLHITDYLIASAPPTTANGTQITGAFICGEVLNLPKSFSGEVIIRYKRKPREISADLNESVDVPSIAEHLLPLLTAAYLWLDDSPDKAEYYMELYRIERAGIKKSVSNSVGEKYADVTGWA
jgi:hypothetical protein